MYCWLPDGDLCHICCQCRYTQTCLIFPNGFVVLMLSLIIFPVPFRVSYDISVIASLMDLRGFPQGRLNLHFPWCVRILSIFMCLLIVVLVFVSRKFYKFLSPLLLGTSGLFYLCDVKLDFSILIFNLKIYMFEYKFW